MPRGGEVAVKVPRSGASSVTTKVTTGTLGAMNPEYKKSGGNVKATTLPTGGQHNAARGGRKGKS